MKRAGFALFAAAALLLGAFSLGQSPHRASAQTSAPATAAVQTWHIQADNISPPGHNWSFNAFYPDHVQAHPGDTLVFSVADNPNAFHSAALLTPGGLPFLAYSGYVFPDEDAPNQLMSTFFSTKPNFGFSPKKPCGRAGAAPCPFDAFNTGAVKSPVLIAPSTLTGAEGNPSFSLTIQPSVPPGTYYFYCLVHGPSMSGSVDIVAPDQPVQSAAQLKEDADREYQTDLAKLPDVERAMRTPGWVTTLDGQRTWTVAAGQGSADGRVSVNDFGVHQLFVRQGDTVTWTNQSPPIVAHTVSGFTTTPDQTPPKLSPFEPVCGGIDPNFGGETEPDTSAPPGSLFPANIWNTCQVREENHLTAYAQPSVTSGSVYTGGAVSSGILLPADFLAQPVAEGLPFSNSFSLTFPDAGTYSYTCAIHYGMQATIIVQKTQ